jgi:UDP-N-acetylmuramate dehydrogenase
MEILENSPLSEILFYKIGGTARYLLKVTNKEDLLEALEFVKEKNIFRILPLGLGSNILMHDGVFDGAVLWFSKTESTPITLLPNGTVEAFSSLTLDDVVKFSFKNNLLGISWSGGLPSTVGAAVRGNAGCFGHEMKDVVVKAEVIDISSTGLKISEMTHTDLLFGYRTSIVKQHKNLIVSTVYLSLKSGNQEEMIDAKQEYERNIEYRNKNHPTEYPSCGSVFKNITKKEEVENVLSIWEDLRETSTTKWHNKIAMGYVIKRMGLSGMQIGGAQISTKHSNYIVNLGGATFNDVYSLIETIKEKFNTQFGFTPETEVEIIKE